MSILQIVYKSRGVEGLDEAEVLEIMRVSQTRNQPRKISGLLVYFAPDFVQLLEGPSDAVIELYEQIARDPRHHAIEIIERREAEHAAMPAWAMGYFSPSMETAAEATGDFVFNGQQVEQICEALPHAIGAPFLEALKART